VIVKQYVVIGKIHLFANGYGFLKAHRSFNNAFCSDWINTSDQSKWKAFIFIMHICNLSLVCMVFQEFHRNHLGIKSLKVGNDIFTFYIA